ncbi:hypothetical protein NCCP2495_31930 [Dietzia sp. NCCP-2495]|uniref:DUF2993 domain-containing protein n=1 Tax=Dietzia sp. NCCP-2495 TaxID=2934675 RepID=UPI00223035A7|nr:DUF2993 domain-containing protein [Dietzia sp. NCCP-2495]GLB65313.1 hypothetical protein NCCP2495_31930 [Dietzia sp. NCCP-2495]
MRVPRIAVAAITLVLVAGGGAFTVDAVSASRVEAEISARVDSARGDSSQADPARDDSAPVDSAGSAPAPGNAGPSRAPAVSIGGPTSRWTDPDTLTTVSIRAEDVLRPGLGPVTVEAHARGVEMRDGEPLHAESVEVSAQLTGDSLAPALGMRSVLVGAADDPSLAGGEEHRARLTGTLLDSGETVSVIVDLVVDPSGAHLVPVAAATGPAGVADQDTDLALASTALTLDPDLLPLGVPVQRLTVTSGTITASGTGGPGTPPLDDLLRRDL